MARRGLCAFVLCWGGFGGWGEKRGGGGKGEGGGGGGLPPIYKKGYGRGRGGCSRIGVEAGAKTGGKERRDGGV